MQPLSDSKCSEVEGLSDGGTVSLPILSVKNNPIIRKAKNIRTDPQNTALDVPKTTASNKLLYDPTKTEYSKIIQPPPYHIAAARSLQSQYFNSLGCNECVTLTRLDQKSPSEEKLITSDENYSKYSTNRKEYDEISNFVQEHVPLTSDVIQNLNYDNETYSSNFSSCYDDIKTEYNKNNFCNIQNQNDYKLRTFIQDKPSPSEYIVAPTPKRPISSDSIGMQLYQETNNSTNVQPCIMTNKVNGCTQNKNELHNNEDVVVNDEKVKRKSISNYDDKTTPSNSTIKWAFGQHKNATVVQVTIQKNSDLGFTISEKQGHVCN